MKKNKLAIVFFSVLIVATVIFILNHQAKQRQKDAWMLRFLNVNFAKVQQKNGQAIIIPRINYHKWSSAATGATLPRAAVPIVLNLCHTT